MDICLNKLESQYLLVFTLCFWTDAHYTSTESIPRWWKVTESSQRQNVSLARFAPEELRLSDEIGKYVLENPLRRMTKAQFTEVHG